MTVTYLHFVLFFLYAEDIEFNLYTNNFYKQVREGVKNSGLWLDTWALYDGFTSQPSVNHYPDKLKNLQGKGKKGTKYWGKIEKNYSFQG